MLFQLLFFLFFDIVFSTEAQSPKFYPRGSALRATDTADASTALSDSQEAFDVSKSSDMASSESLKEPHLPITERCSVENNTLTKLSEQPYLIKQPSFWSSLMEHDCNDTSGVIEILSQNKDEWKMYYRLHVILSFEKCFW